MPLKAPITRASRVGGEPTWATTIDTSSRWHVSATAAKKPMLPYNWRPAKWVEECHPKIAAVMEPFLTKFRGRCSVSNILTAGNKWLDSRPRLNAYPAGICWLHSIASCPYGTQCSFLAGHVKKGKITDSIANEVIGALQPGITEMMNKPPTSPLGKCKWRGPG